MTRWQEVSLREAKAIFEQDMVASDIALASSTSTVVHDHLPGPDDNALALRESWVRSARACLAQRRSAVKDAEHPAGEALALVEVAGRLAPVEVKSPPPPRPSVAPLPVTVQSEDPDELFNALARARWARPGHSNRPEPFSLVMQGSDGTGNIWLGGMPYDDDLPFLRRQRIDLLLSCMKDCSCDERQGISAETVLQFSLPVGYAGRERDEAWRDVKSIALATLRDGKSVLVHCRAGVHRGPVGCAALMGFVTRSPFDDCLKESPSRRKACTRISTQQCLLVRGNNRLQKSLQMSFQAMATSMLPKCFAPYTTIFVVFHIPSHLQNCIEKLHVVCQIG